MSKDLEMVKRYTAKVNDENGHLYLTDIFYRKGRGSVLTKDLRKAVAIKKDYLPNLEQYMGAEFDGIDWSIEEVIIAVTSPADYLTPLYDLSKMCKQKDKDLKESNVVINRLLKEAEGYALTIASMNSTISDLQADVQNIEDLKLKLSTFERDQIDKSLLSRLEKEVATMADRNSALVTTNTMLNNEIESLKEAIQHSQAEEKASRDLYEEAVESTKEVTDDLYSIKTSFKESQDMLNALINDLTESD